MKDKFQNIASSGQGAHSTSKSEKHSSNARSVGDRWMLNSSEIKTGADDG